MLATRTPKAALEYDVVAPSLFTDESRKKVNVHVSLIWSFRLKIMLKLV